MTREVEVEMIRERNGYKIFQGKPLKFINPKESLDISLEYAEDQEITVREYEADTPPPTPATPPISKKLPDFATTYQNERKKEDTVTKPPPRTEDKPLNEFEEIHFWLAIKVYFAWSILVFFGFFREFLVRLGLEKEKGRSDNPKHKGFVPLYNDFDSMYIRRMYIRVRDVFERPIGSCPGATVNVIDRYSEDGNWTYKFPGTQTEVINMASYNYLGFAQTKGPCADSAVSSIEKHGVAVCSTTQERGSTSYQRRLESLVADFLAVEDTICFSMGFATNSMNIACLADKNTLVISDQRNHASLILGMRMAGASAKVFSHNNMEELEDVLLAAVKNGNPKTGKPYSKILIVVEGIYSMEGSICPLPDIIRLKKKYKAYLYLDEAHSIGAMGSTGRGVVEYFGCDVKDVDLMMGTFTKSFGAAGGYIGGTKEIINHIRIQSATGFYSSPMSPPIAEQIFTSTSMIMGKDGSNEGAKRIEHLARNARYFRMKLKQAGQIIYGSNDSPVVPMLLYVPGFVGYYGREMLKRNVGVVVVSYPACEMVEARVRFCVSAAHTKEQLDEVLKQLSLLADNTGSRFSKKTHLFKDLEIEW